MIEVIIPREEFPVKTIAVVRAKVTDKVRNATELREAITAAVTEWHASDCPEAKKAWEYSGDDFNIGDLESYAWTVADKEGPEGDDGWWLSHCKLPQFLESHGVENLSIEIADVNDSSSEWNFDTPLTNYSPEEDE
jgi:hypothetical protein